MGTHELENELTEIADTMGTDLGTEVQEQFPSLSIEDAVNVARLDIALRLILPNVSDKKFSQVRNGVVDQLTTAGIEWAERFKKASFEKFRPHYDNAVSVGVDPASVIAANAQIPLTEARLVARAFVKADKEAAKAAAKNAAASTEDNGAPLTDGEATAATEDGGDDPFPAAQGEGDPFTADDADKVPANV